ncbi:protein FAM133-like isoform X1 [Argiope bruennichi]|uniref:Protein FAM133B like protein n=1 Tax=Argiope bruennichi TaxID=94029 RepID=A0A8T0E3N3_ARGBR|nr:protein FAM133-like isoform X1 [Argiope bruennichi]KAF8766499.1 Protein FAM133B like protein [Argiope bruennichi]
MGKRDTRYAFMNPIAMARARGPISSGGPSIRDYMNRDRPSWEEVKEILQKKKEGSKTLAAWEEKMNDKFREELRRNREKLLGESSSCEKKKSKKRKKKRSSSSSSSSSSRSKEDNSEDEARSYKHKHKKSKKKKHDKYLNEHKKHSDSSSKYSKGIKKKHKREK